MPVVRCRGDPRLKCESHCDRGTVAPAVASHRAIDPDVPAHHAPVDACVCACIAVVPACRTPHIRSAGSLYTRSGRCTAHIEVRVVAGGSRGAKRASTSARGQPGAELWRFAAASRPRAERARRPASSGGGAGRGGIPHHTTRRCRGVRSYIHNIRPRLRRSTCLAAATCTLYKLLPAHCPCMKNAALAALAAAGPWHKCGQRTTSALPPSATAAPQASSPPSGSSDSDVVVPLSISLVLTTLSLVIGGIVWWRRRREVRKHGKASSEHHKGAHRSHSSPDGTVRVLALALHIFVHWAVSTFARVKRARHRCQRR